jgi:C-terminal processing protease CtpA/Prc
VDGEIKVMKSDVKRLSLDDEESNLLRLAQNAKDADDAAKAYYFYDKALAVNPQSKSAKEGISLLKMQSWQKEKKKKLSDLELQAEIDTYGSPKPRQPETDPMAGLKERLDSEMGISLGMEGSFPVFTKVKNGSSASVSGIERGDRLVAVWGKLTGYMSFQDVVDVLLKKSSMEVRCTVERTVRVAVNPNRAISLPGDLIGASLGIGPEGLALFTVKPLGAAEKAGLAKGDLVVAIDGVPTRYLQLNRALKVIKDAKGDHVKLTFRRDVVIWKGGAA